MADEPRAVVRSHLLRDNWKVLGRGPVGELWGRGTRELALPYDLDPESPAWGRIALALAQESGYPAADILKAWAAELDHRSHHPFNPGPQPRSTPGRIEFDMHLDGPTVSGHETSAYDFGIFVMRTADSVKELVKNRLGIRHHSRNLLVAGGAGEGSVRVLFREPDRADRQALVSESPETAEGQALVYLASVFTAAETSAEESNVLKPDSDPLTAHLASLSVGARLGIARLADALTGGGWELSGVIRRGSEEEALQLGLYGATILGESARAQLQEEDMQTVAGTLDGWRWSRSELTLITDQGRSLYVSVPMHLQEQVAELNASPERGVTTRLAVYRNVVSGTHDAVRTSYVLDSIVAVPELASAEDAPASAGLRRRSGSPGKFEVYQDKRSKFRWRLKAGNGEVVATSVAYESKQAAIRAAEAFQGAAVPSTAVLEVD